MKKFACFTLDLERDYGQDNIDSRWMVDEFLLRDEHLFKEIFEPLGIPITAFTVAKLIEETPEILDSLNNAGTDIQLHSYNHDLSRSVEDDINDSLEIFDNYLGKKPIGYRAPQGMLKPDELETISNQGFKYDSSIFPFFRPTKFWNFSVPQTPFYLEEYDLYEYPIGSIPKLRYPLTLSYIQLLGWNNCVKLLETFGHPQFLVFDFHLHDFYASKSYTQLSPGWQQIYKRIFSSNPWQVFKSIISYLRNREYQFISLSNVSKHVKVKVRK